MTSLNCTDTHLLSRVFWSLLDQQKVDPVVQLFDIAEEARLSALFDMSGIQDSMRFRAISRARKMSFALLDEKGELKSDVLANLISFFENRGFIFYPGGNSDSLMRQQMLHFLKFLNKESTILKRFQKPLCHKWAETLIADTLGISPTSLTDRDIRAAVLCACLTPLRQNVGSCFATAPAILIQREQPRSFLDDLYQLLTTGQLKRTFGGIEYALPMSPSTGIAELKKNLLADPKLQVHYSPGLMAALQCAGVINDSMQEKEKAHIIELQLPEYAKDKKIFTVEQLIRAVLLKKYQLTPSDLERAKNLEIAQLKKAKMALHDTDPSVFRHEQILAFKQKEKECRSAFKNTCDNALLRAWEFTLASFSEVKMEFSRWNLYCSLGLGYDQEGGIGAVIYTKIEEKIADINKKLEDAHKQYEIAFDQVRAVEVLFRNVSSESDARRLQAEYQSRAYHMRACLERRDALHEKGTHYSKFYAFLIEQYDRQFPRYFQEIYDAEMQDLQQGDIYEDSPAGFRLVYKHGRIDPSIWTLIYNEEQYLDALQDFFTLTETQIAAAEGWENYSSDIVDFTSAIIFHLRTPYFLQTALARIQKIHPGSFNKPWAYISGGTMTTLLKTYFRREMELTTEEKWVESESELLIFILDTLKNLPPKNTNSYIKDDAKGMLMSSPTHAFLLLPGLSSLKKGWQNDLFTYTWVRDEVILPGQNFYNAIQLNHEEQLFLFDLFAEQLPPMMSHNLYRAYQAKDEKKSVSQWRNEIAAFLTEDFVDKLDGFLYQSLPLIPHEHWKAAIRLLLKEEKTLELFSEPHTAYLTARQIKDTAIACYLLATQNLFLSFDLYETIAIQSREAGLAAPNPVLFADSNWAGNYFAFLVNPGNQQLQLWRVDKNLLLGYPMRSWKSFLDGTEKKTWSILTRSHEYEY